MPVSSEPRRRRHAHTDGQRPYYCGRDQQEKAGRKFGKDDWNSGDKCRMAPFPRPHASCLAKGSPVNKHKRSAQMWN
jgi:hypothetical protein